jgi:hypothetical protein
MRRMFGNRLGWGISALIAMFAGFLAHLIYQAARVSPPTGWVQTAVKPLTVPAGAGSVVADMNDPRDAGEFYRRAIGDYLSNRQAYAATETATDAKVLTESHVEGIAALVDATHLQTMNLFAAEPQEVVSYDAERAPLEAIYHVGKAALREAALLRRDDPDQTKRLYEAVFSLGVKLYRERVVFDELSKGEDLMGTAAAGLQQLAQHDKDTARATALQQFNNNRLSEYQATIQPVWQVVSSIDPTIVAGYAGDLFVLAKDRNVDQVWRVEATLKLGRLQYNAGDEMGRRGNQLAAKRVLKEMAADSSEDPAVRIAAEKGRDLTALEFRQLR